MIKQYKQSGIYEIVNVANNKRYIGSSKDMDERWKIHKSELDKGTHHSPILQSVWVKHGEGCFVFNIICYVDPNYLLEVEQKFLDRHFGDQCYNVNPIATKPPRNPGGRVYSDAAKKNISAARKRDGTKPPSRKGCIPWNKGKKCKSSWNKGKPHSEEHKQKLKEARRKRTLKKYD